MGLFTKSNPKSIPAPLPLGKDGADIVPPPAPADSMASSIKPQVAKQSVPLNERQLYFQQLRVRIHQQLVERLDVQNLRTLPADTVRSEVRVLIRELCQSEKGLINSI